jgi:hypothetical protein
VIDENWKDRRIQQAVQDNVSRGVFRKLIREGREKYNQSVNYTTMVEAHQTL